MRPSVTIPRSPQPPQPATAEPADDELALFGGRPAVTTPRPHAPRAVFTPDDRRAVSAYIDGEANPNSCVGSEGIVGELEGDLARYFGRRHALLTNSGTSALYSAFVAAGIGPGDEVIAPVYTFPATVTPLLQIGAVPVLADVEPSSGVIDPADVERRIGPKTKAVVATHQWGHPFDSDVLPALAAERGLPLIEDVSLAPGATSRGRRAGALGTVAALSLGSTKLLSGGQGGALLCDDDDILARAALVGRFGGSGPAGGSPYATTGLGHNFRIHPLGAAMARGRLLRIEQLIAARHERFELLSALLGATGCFRPPATARWASRGAWQGYVAHYVAGDAVPFGRVVEALLAEGLEVYPYGYQPLLHRQPALAGGTDPLERALLAGSEWRRYRWGDFPAAERFVATAIGFPLFLDEPLELVEAYGFACLKVACHRRRLLP